MEIANPADEREMYYIEIAKLPVLQYCVKIMIQILYVSFTYIILLSLVKKIIRSLMIKYIDIR